MKCIDVRTFFSQIAAKSVSMQIQPADLDSLSTNGYLSQMEKVDYDLALGEVSNLTQINEQLQKEEMEAKISQATRDKDERKTHSILFHFEGREAKEALLKKVESESMTFSKEKADVDAVESKIAELIQKKSMIDRMVPYGGTYLSLTGLGVVTLNDLNVRNYRVSDSEFSDFIEESKETTSELRSIAERGSFYVSGLRTEFPKTDFSQLWNVSIGLGKLQGDQNQISERFRLALGLLEQLKSTIENKMMAAEIMTSFRASSSQSSTDNSDLQIFSQSLVSLDQEVRHRANVPKQLSAGVAAMIMFGRRYDGTYPTERFAEFSKMTNSYESAAILAVNNSPSDQLAVKFQSFRSLFNSWGYQTSEDTELASAYFSISDFGPNDVKTKMTIIVDALKNYLEYPLVAAAILTSIPTLEAIETLDLVEKSYSLLWPFAGSLDRSELICIAVRMIHGIKNELVKQLDPTAKIAKTPVQLRIAPSNIFFGYYAPFIVVHSSYFSTFSGIGGSHPAHVHGVGGFSG
ncbi:MAG: hypothetical protein M1368_07135 [Thaumarchaeota archaeon]|nr:hypothetical protein [Nitrososphaerota archaeon]